MLKNLYHFSGFICLILWKFNKSKYLKGVKCKCIPGDMRMIPVLNRYHEYVLRAFLEVQIPSTLKEKAPSLLVTDSVIGSCCAQLIKKDKFLKIPSKSIITTDDSERLMSLIGTADEEYERTELMDYYRLVMLTTSVLKEYAET